MNIRAGAIVITETGPHFPVPVGTEAIAPSIPDTQYKPGKSGEQKREQVPFPRFWKDPAECIEQYEQAVEEEEKNIEQPVDHNRRFW